MTGYQSKKHMAQAKLDSMEREALKLALEALKEISRHATTPYEDDWCGELAEEAITAAEAALAQPAQEPNFGPQPDMHYGMNQDDWKDVVAAISKVRDSRGIYLACRPADVFQDWFLAMGLFKPKENNT